jgi:hypothetical protein
LLPPRQCRGAVSYEPGVEPDDRHEAEGGDPYVTPALVVALSEFCVSVLATAGAEALSNFGFQYLSQVYLPQKLRDGDWI